MAERADMVDFSALSLGTEESWYRRRRGSDVKQRAFLTFLVGDAEYGLELLRLLEIIKARPTTEVPRAPGFIAGVISVRGLVMPVIDLRIRLGGERGDETPPATRCLVVNRGQDRFGLLVDAVHQVVQLREEEIEPPPAMLSRSESEYIAGIGRAQEDVERLIILLDLDAVLRFDLRRHALHREAAR